LYGRRQQRDAGTSNANMHLNCPDSAEIKRATRLPSFDINVKML
jgi:hypothetical protein